jgi:hypothetical protein
MINKLTLIDLVVALFIFSYNTSLYTAISDIIRIYLNFLNLLVLLKTRRFQPKITTAEDLDLLNCNKQNIQMTYLLQINFF